ncbi:LysR family transcriptional regulator [Amycolatopsis sp. lyj-90]|uniref:LysR family transcriptional regulator n=1 Tax=Amycolatopsis sp. lyj-90 TaxID=2789285 RepID=UPI00397863E6
MEIKQVYYFTVLAEELHFSRAASRLNISQPTLSGQIRQLENGLGTVLISRTSRRVSLTTAGEMLLSYARAILNQIQRAEQAIGDLREGVSGRLRIGSMPAGVNGPLASLLGKLSAAEPGILVDLRHYGGSAEQIKAVVEESLDLAFLREPSCSPSLRVTKVLEESFSVYLPSDHRFAGRSVLSLKDLREEVFVSAPQDVEMGLHALICKALDGRNFSPRVRGLADSPMGQLAMVAAGLGVAVLADTNTSIRRDGTVRVPLVPGELKASLFVVYRKWHQNNPAIEKFLNFLPGAVRP